MNSIVLFDIDGTILGDYHNIPDSTVEAIRKLRKRGNIALIDTGRARSIVPKEVMDIGFDGCICGCGSSIEIGGNLIENNIISDVLLEKVNSALDSEHIFTCYEGYEAIYYYSRDKLFEERVLEDWGKNIIREKAQPFSKYSSNINKISCHYKDENLMMEKYKVFEEEMYPIVHGDGFLEFILRGHTKASPIEKFDQLFPNHGKVYALGDSSNDLSMIIEADVGIAMGNGVDQLKEHADYITDDIYEDGLMKALSYFDLI